VIRIDGLHQDDARRLAASGASGGLRQQLKGALGRAKIRQPQADIGVHDADQRHVRNVVALGDHLRADQNVVRSPRESRRTVS
jgi:hypothetical protein